MFGLTASLPSKSPELLGAELALENLNAKMAALHKEQSQLDTATARYAGREDVSAQTAAQRKRLTEIRDELRTLYDQVHPANSAVSEHRQPYAQAIASAFAAKRKNAASQILIALAAIEFQTSLLKETAAVIARAGGQVASMPEI